MKNATATSQGNRRVLAALARRADSAAEVGPEGFIRWGWP
jgi:hypothetical protein